MKFLYHIFAYTSLGLITFLMANEITTNFFTNEIDRWYWFNVKSTKDMYKTIDNGCM